VLLFTHHFFFTYGEPIAATQFRPPHIYAFIFLVSLPGQFLFGVTTMTLPAVVTMYLWGQAYFALTGSYFQFQSYISIAVFLAMHLLITDPSTSPRTELGRILYGIAYALTVIVLELTVHPGFPAKLLLVPALNLSVQLIDKAAQSRALRRFDPARIAPQVTGRRRNLAYMAIWTAVFAVMLFLRGLGDRFPGQDVPFWQKACEEHHERACTKLKANVLNTGCQRESGWACNDLALMKIRDLGEQAAHGKPEISGSLARACKLGFQPGCENAQRFKRGDGIEDAPPTVADYRILLSLYKTSRQAELEAMTPSEVYAVACRHGWEVACGQ
jgi:hypothetical protein